MTQGGIDSGCKWPGKANQWYTSHHMAGEDLGEGRMHARRATCSTASRQDLEQTGVSTRCQPPEETEREKRRVDTRRGRRKRVGSSYVNQRAD